MHLFSMMQQIKFQIFRDFLLLECFFALGGLHHRIYHKMYDFWSIASIF